MSSTIENPADFTSPRREQGPREEKPLLAPRAGADPMTVPFPVKKKASKHAVVRGFGPRPQQEFLKWLLQGASPQLACKKLKLPLSTFWRAVENDPEFAGKLQAVWDTLSFDVVAALYQSAIKGNAQAQQFWLKYRPAPRWANSNGESSFTDDLESLSHDELLERIRTEAPDLAVAIAARDLAKRSGCSSETVPAAPESPTQ